MDHRRQPVSRLCVALVLALGCAATCSAADLTLHFAGGYGGLKFDRALFDRNVEPYANGTANADIKNKGLDTRLGVTWRLTPHFALEAGYTQSAKATYTAPLTSGATASGSVLVEGVTLSGLGFMPLTKSLALFLRGGAMYGLTKSKLDGGDISPISAADYRLAPQVGVGLEYTLDKVFCLRTEIEHVGSLGDAQRTGRTDRTTLWIGFGGKL